MALRSADRIREELEQAIMAAEFAEGERLDEVTLAARFSVSRTPVREALHALAASGLVETLPRRGVFVRYPSFIKLVEMFDVM
ncbi:MAG: GntR family transcriptional regulator, partial [Rhizobiales bacterium]|nr:GntR family transcriptional regulator [Hyphomicrobiales bacterium]